MSVKARLCCATDGLFTNFIFRFPILKKVKWKPSLSFIVPIREDGALSNRRIKHSVKKVILRDLLTNFVFLQLFEYLFGRINSSRSLAVS